MAGDKFPDYKKLKVENLIPYANNSRTHSDEQVNQIASSIKEFGFTNPVLIDSCGGIIAGHGRVMAAKKLGMSEVPCIALSHLTEAQKKAYIIADNQIPLNAGWDMDMLKLEIDHLREVDFDVGLLGFDDDFVAKVDCEFSDLEIVEAFNETFNFNIVCDDLEELSLVQAALGAGGKKIDAKKLLELIK